MSRELEFGVPARQGLLTQLTASLAKLGHLHAQQCQSPFFSINVAHSGTAFSLNGARGPRMIPTAHTTMRLKQV